MPYVTCLVASCKTRRKPNANKNEILKCFSFPKDPVLKKEWLNLCNVKDISQADYSTRKVCIKHFKEDDFVDGLKARLLCLEPRILKKNAVPSLFLNDESEVDNTDETEIEKQDVMLQKLMEQTNKASKVEERTDQKYGSKEYLSKLVPIAPKGPVLAQRGPSERRQYAKYLKQYDSAPKKPKAQGLSEHYNKILQHDNAIYKKRITELLANQEKLKLRIKKLESTIRKDEEEFVARIKEVFSHILTPNQVDVIMRKKKRACWNHEEYTKAYTLQHLSTNAYFYVRDTLNYPLPAFSSLQQWASRYGVDIPDCHDDAKINPPLPKCMKLRFDKIKKHVKKNNYKTDLVSEGMESTPDDVGTIDEHFIPDLKGEPESEYMDIYDDSDTTKQSDTDDNATVVDTSSADANLKSDNDIEIYEEVDYLDEYTEDGNAIHLCNQLDNVLDKNVSVNDDSEEMDGQVNETAEQPVLDNGNKHEVVANVRVNCSVIEEENG